MARQPKTLDRKAVKDWFSGLTFEVQEAVLSDFSSSFESSKEARIDTLESELRKLRGKNGSAAVVQKPRGRRASSKAGMKVPPKYADKAGNTWAGRGVHPRWITEYLKKRGNKLEDLLISRK